MEGQRPQIAIKCGKVSAQMARGGKEQLFWKGMKVRRRLNTRFRIGPNHRRSSNPES